MIATGSGPDAGMAMVAEIDVPDDWEQSPMAGPVAFMARPRHHDGQVRPTVTVTCALEGSRPSLDHYAEVQLAGTYATFGGYLLFLELTCEPQRRLDLALAIEQMGTDLTIVQRHLLHPDGWAVVATGTVSDADWPAAAPRVLAAVRSLRVVRS